MIEAHEPDDETVLNDYATALLIHSDTPVKDSSFVLGCSNNALHWFAARLRRLVNGHTFVLGETAPVLSDCLCSIMVMLAPEGTGSSLVAMPGTGRFLWIMTVEDASAYAVLAEGLLRSVQGHQYLDVMGRNPSVTLLLSKNEYAADDLRAMRSNAA